MFRASPIASTEIAEDAPSYTKAAQLQKVGGMIVISIWSFQMMNNNQLSCKQRSVCVLKVTWDPSSLCIWWNIRHRPATWSLSWQGIAAIQTGSLEGVMSQCVPSWIKNILS